jgi:hypothetical protein
MANGGRGMRRMAILTSSVVVAAMVVAVTAGASASSAPPAPTIKPGTTWTLRAGSTCEGDSFAAHKKFSGTYYSGSDQGTYKGKKKVTLTWTTGAPTGDVFQGTFNKKTGDYAGTYGPGGQSVAATLAPAATQGCALVETQASAYSITYGQSDSDRVTVTGTGAATPTGSVDFYRCAGSGVCGPTTAGAVDMGSADLTASGSTAIATSASFMPPGGGGYCFDGVYSGDSYYPPTADAFDADCFFVTPAESSLTTSPALSTILVGSDDYDEATVTVGQADTPTGSVEFYECGPEQTATDCTDTTGTELSTGTVGSGGTAKSADFSPLTTGTYCFAGYYSGDDNYNGGEDESGTDECFQVLSKPPPK